MNDNRDAINDILSELDRKKELADAPPEAPAPEGTAPQEAPEPEYEPIHETAPEESSEPATSYTSHGYDDAPRSAAADPLLSARTSRCTERKSAGKRLQTGFRAF